MSAPKYSCTPESARLRVRLAAAMRRIEGLQRTLENYRLGPARRLALPPGLTVDDERWQASLNEQQLKLSDKEYLLLAAMASEPDRVWERRELLQIVWPDLERADITTTRTLDSHAVRLRMAMTEVDPDRNWIENVRGIGYVLLRRPIDVVAREQRAEAILALHQWASGRQIVGVEGDGDGGVRIVLQGGVVIRSSPTGALDVVQPSLGLAA